MPSGKRSKAARRRVPPPPSSRVAWYRGRRWWGAGALVAILAVAGAVIALSSGGGNPQAALPLAPLSTLGTLASFGSAGPIGPEGIPIPAGAALAAAASPAGNATVDGVQCEASEQVLFHIHAHVTIFADGQPRQIPAGIGIAAPRQVDSTPQGDFIVGGGCFYWLHTHASDGIVHVESPVQRTYTLGNFFDEWGQPLGPNRVGPLRGPVTTLFNGHVYRGNPRSVPLLAHAQIQLEIGKPRVRPVTITNWHSL